MSDKEAFFDNITFTPFVFIEDDADLHRTSEYEAVLPTAGRATATFGGPVASTKGGKIDVYHMIVGNHLGSLRVDVERHIPSESPFSASGTLPRLDLDSLHDAFTRAHTLQISPPPRKKTSAAGLLSATSSRAATIESDVTLKVTKVGLLSRKGWSLALPGADFRRVK